MGVPLFKKLHLTTGFVATGSGAAVDVSLYDVPVGVVVGGTFVGTVIIEVSYDLGTTWMPFGSAVTAPGTVKIDIPVQLVRARCSAYTSGTILSYVGATNNNTGDEH